MQARRAATSRWSLVAIVMSATAMLVGCGLDFRPYEPIAVDTGFADIRDANVLPDNVSIDDVDDAAIDESVACGFVDQPCCSDGSCAVGTCEAGICVQCGASGQPCCASSVCNASLVCSASMHCGAPCGALGQPCCDGTTCATGMCSGGTCTACGNEGEPCCAGGACGPSFNCLRALETSGRCTPCGGPGEFCCMAGAPCRGSAACQPISSAAVSICVVSGDGVLGGYCQPGLTDCPLNGTCDIPSNTCFECGRYGEWCCDPGSAPCVPSPTFSCHSGPSGGTFCY